MVLVGPQMFLKQPFTYFPMHRLWCSLKFISRFCCWQQSGQLNTQSSNEWLSVHSYFGSITSLSSPSKMRICIHMNVSLALKGFKEENGHVLLLCCCFACALDAPIVQWGALCLYFWLIYCRTLSRLTTETTHTIHKVLRHGASAANHADCFWLTLTKEEQKVSLYFFIDLSLQHRFDSIREILITIATK